MTDGKMELEQRSRSRRNLFEATLFPGYVFSACYLSYQVVHGVIIMIFAFAATLLIDPVRTEVGRYVWNFAKTLCIMVLVKTILLRMVLFEKILLDGSEVKRLFWHSVLFPAFVVSNFVLGLYLGVARGVLGVLILLCRSSRVDISVVPEGVTIVSDAAYQSFLAVVAMAEKEYNPTKRAFLKCIFGHQIYASVYLRSTASENEAAEPGAARPEDASPNRDVATKWQRAVVRWHLALTLARNPTLQLDRGHRLEHARQEAQRQAAEATIYRQHVVPIWQQQVQPRLSAMRRGVRPLMVRANLLQAPDLSPAGVELPAAASITSRVLHGSVDGALASGSGGGTSSFPLPPAASSKRTPAYLDERRHL